MEVPREIWELILLIWCFLDILSILWYIEKSLLLLHDNVVSGSELLKLLGISKFSICSFKTATSLVNDIKLAWYSLQLSECVILKNLLVAHSSMSSAISHLNWLGEISTSSIIPPYWKQIIELQIHNLIYILLIRESNCQLHILALCALMKWYFALDFASHLNFYRGHFPFNKSCTEFSSMGWPSSMKEKMKSPWVLVGPEVF